MPELHADDGFREHLEEALGGAFVIERELGGGGMSRVFLAKERSLGRHVVIKLLASELAGAINAERFVREMHIAARLQHPHIVPLLTAGNANGVPYYTMPFVVGESLAQRLERERVLSVEAAISLLRDVASALSHAHREGVVHRDLKPGNVLLTEDRAQVSDFGLAKALGASTRAGSLTAPGLVVGTPAYMAPEQVLGDPNTDYRADIYAFGVLAYEALTGEPPFASSSTQELLAAQVTRAPKELSTRRKGLPTALTRVVMACLAKDPAMRPSADALLNELGAPAIHGWPHGSRRSRVLYATAAAMIAVMVATAVAISLRPVQPAAAGPPLQTVAVLPFENRSADKNDEYFSDGLTDELTNALASVTGLRVTAHSSAFVFKGKATDAREVAQRLGVARIVEGTVRRVGGELRLTAALIDSGSGRTLWSRSYQRSTKDVLDVQQELADAIARELLPKLATNRSRPSSGRVTDNAEAYDLYLRALYLLDARTKESLTESIRYLQSALQRDSSFALAHLGIARAYDYLRAVGYIDSQTGHSATRTALLRALALDERLAEAHVLLGDLKFDFEFDPAGAEEEYRRALTLSPELADAHYSYGLFLASRGRFDASVAEVRHALEIDPLSLARAANLGRILGYAGRLDEALAQGRRVVMTDPSYGVGHLWLGATQMYRGQPALALEEFQAAAATMPGTTLPWSGVAAARFQLGEHDAALRLLHELEHTSTRGPPNPYVLALGYVVVGDPDRAFAWLDSGYVSRTYGMNYLGVDPFFVPVRRDPRFVQMMHKLRLDE